MRKLAKIMETTPHFSLVLALGYNIFFDISRTLQLQKRKLAHLLLFVLAPPLAYMFVAMITRQAPMPN